MKRREKERAKQEEEIAARKIEEERIRLKEEYQKELEQQQQKEVELKAKNEALKKESEAKRLLAQTREVERQEREEKEVQLKTNTRLHRRAHSPPVPALKVQLQHQRLASPTILHRETFRSQSPPVPALQKKLNQPQPMTQGPPQPQSVTQGPPQPQSVTQGPPQPQPVTQGPPLVDQPVAQGPPLVDQPVIQGPPRPQQVTQGPPLVDQPVTQGPPLVDQPVSSAINGVGAVSDNGDSESVIEKLTVIRRMLSDVELKQTEKRKSIFEPVRVDRRRFSGRSQQITGPDALQQFSQLKYQRSREREDFLDKYPTPPYSDSSLELQQVELLKHQKDKLKRLQETVLKQTSVDKENQKVVSSERNRRRDQKNSQNWTLSAKFQGSEGVSEITLRPGTQGSSVSFDVDSIAERNRVRLAELHAALGGRGKAAEAKTHRLGRKEPLSVGSETSLDHETTFHPI